MSKNTVVDNRTEINNLRIENARIKAEVNMMKALSRGHSTSHLYQQMAEENERLNSELNKLKEVIDSFKCMPIDEHQTFSGWRLDEEFRIKSLIDCLKTGSVEAAITFTHRNQREFRKSLTEKQNSAKDIVQP
jgi:hypothetical protein